MWQTQPLDSLSVILRCALLRASKDEGLKEIKMSGLVKKKPLRRAASPARLSSQLALRVRSRNCSCCAGSTSFDNSHNAAQAHRHTRRRHTSHTRELSHMRSPAHRRNPGPRSSRSSHCCRPSRQLPRPLPHRPLSLNLTRTCRNSAAPRHSRAINDLNQCLVDRPATPLP